MRKEKVATVGEYENYLINRTDSALNVLGLDEDGRDLAANQVTPDDVTRWLRGFHAIGALTRTEPRLDRRLAQSRQRCGYSLQTL